MILGNNTSLSCTDLAAAGRAKFRSNSSTNARLKIRILGIAHNLRRCAGLILFSRFSDVFYVDASTKETISADLSQIALAKGIGESEKDTLDWLRKQRKEWLLLLDNADDPTLNLPSYFPRCTHGNILITSRNRDICVHAPQFCQVSDMKPDEARDLLLKHARLEHNNETEAPAMRIVKVH